MEQAILITGGAGFIGVNLVRQLLAEEPQTTIVNLDKLTYAGNLQSLNDLAGNPRYRFACGDIGNAALVAGLLAEYRPQAIVHLAAESHVDRSIDGPAPFVATNIVGTFMLLEQALAYWRSLATSAQEGFRFLHVSTDEVYGSLGATGAFSETSPYQPSSPYSASKAAADHLVRAYHHTYGLPTIVTNSSNNYGPYQFPEKFLPLLIRNARAGRPLPIYGDGRQVRDWLYVADHCQALRRVLHDGSPGETYLIGGGEERSNLQMAQSLCALLDELRPAQHGSYTRQIAFVADRPGHDWRYAINARKIERDLGWRPAHTLDDGLRATVLWYLENEAWSQNVTRGKYNGERLGLGRG